MRCPKCSFISFDDLAVCAKCSGDLSALSKELNGTCIEARPEFFLGSAIQTPTLDEDNFSDSQVLPPIDHGGINFDDTSTGGFSPLASGASSAAFDDSIGVSAEDDVAIELGDIMPIDLDQLDDTSVFAGQSLADTDSFDPGNFALDLDKTETMNIAGGSNLDLDSTGNFTSTNLEQSLEDDFSDIDIDEADFDFASDTLLASGTGSSEDLPPGPDLLRGDNPTHDNSVGLDLDDELIAQLSSFADDLDSVSDSQPVLSDSGVAPGTNISDDSGSLELDDSLVAELTGAFPAGEVSDDGLLNYSSDPSGSGEFKLDESLVAELAEDATAGEIFDDVDLEDRDEISNAVPVADQFLEDDLATPIEDLTGEFAALGYGEEPELGDLNLSDIDVTDLIESSTDALSVSDGQRAESLVEEFQPEVSVVSELSGASGEGDESNAVGDLAAPQPVASGEQSGLDSDSSALQADDSGLALAEDLDGDFPSGAADVVGAVPSETPQALEEVDVSDLLVANDEDSVWGSGTSQSPLDLSTESSSPEHFPTLDIDDSGLSGLADDSLLTAGHDGLAATAKAQSGQAETDFDPFDEIDISELEAELNVASPVAGDAIDDGLPEIELIPDEDDGEVPPDLPL